MKYFLLFISFFLVCPNFSHAGTYLTMKYSAKKGESLKSIVIYFLKEGTPPVRANESLSLTMKKNASIKTWNPLASDVRFKLYLDPAIVDLKKYNTYYLMDKEKDVHHLSLSSMPSFGQFSQSNNNGYNVKYNQISFLSLGLGYLYTPFKRPYNVSASFYYSTISPTSNQISSGGSTSVDIPGEYGLTVYGVYKPEFSQFSFYTGLDFESFSSFNIQNILSNNTIVIDTNNVYYLTVGINFKPNFMEKLSLKLSLSKSFFTSYSSDLSSGSKVQLSGIKILAFLNYQLDEKWFINTMYKSHSFSGDNDLSINRLGVGVSYLLF